MNTETRMNALELIETAQRGNGTHGTAPVTVTIGSVSDNTGIVRHDTLVVENAPAAVLDALRDAGYSLSVRDGGVHVAGHGVDA